MLGQKHVRLLISTAVASACVYVKPSWRVAPLPLAAAQRLFSKMSFMHDLLRSGSSSPSKRTEVIWGWFQRDRCEICMEPSGESHGSRWPNVAMRTTAALSAARTSSAPSETTEVTIQAGRSAVNASR